MGDGRGKDIPGIENSVYEGTEAGNSMVYLETVAEEKCGDLFVSVKDSILHTALDKYWGEELVGADRKDIVDTELTKLNLPSPQIAYESVSMRLENCSVLKLELELHRTIVINESYFKTSPLFYLHLHEVSSSIH